MIIITIVTYITVIIVLYIYNILQYILAVLLLALILSFITDTLSGHCVNFFICEHSTQNLPKCTII